MEHVRQELRSVNDVCVTLNAKKCEFFPSRIDYPNQDTHTGRIDVLKRTIDAVRKLEQPTTSMELQSLPELCSVSQHFVPNFARVATPRKMKLQNGQLQTSDGLPTKNPQP